MKENNSFFDDDIYKMPNQNNDSSIHKYSNIYGENEKDISGIDISETTPENFPNNDKKSFHYICEKCLSFPEISFLNQNIINFKCDLDNHHRELSIKDIKESIAIIDIDSIYNNKIICNDHDKKYSYFCNNCSKNLCKICQQKCSFNNHEIIDLVDTHLLNQVTQIKNEIKEKQKKKCGNKADMVVNTISFVKNDSGNFIKINNNDKRETIDILSLLDKDIEGKYLGFFFIVIEDYINYPNNINLCNVKKIIKFWFDFYCPNRFVMVYKQKSYYNTKIKIFGKKFVENNKDNCFLVINEKKFELTEYIDIPKKYEKKRFNHLCNIEVILYENNEKRINDISYMFYEVESLFSLSDDSTFDVININNMSHTFYGCISLENINCIYKWNTFNVTDMSYMFYNCSSLTNFPNISQWNTTNLKQYDCLTNNNIPSNLLPNILNIGIIIYNNSIKNIAKRKGDNCSIIILYIIGFTSTILALIIIIILIGLLLYSIPISFILYFINKLGDLRVYLSVFLLFFYFLFKPFLLVITYIMPFEEEKYINKHLYHNYFLKVNNNKKFQDDKKALIILNSISTIIYFSLILSIYYGRFFKSNLFFIVFVLLDVFFLIINYLNYAIISRLSVSFKELENMIYKRSKKILSFYSFDSDSNFIEYLCVLCSFHLFVIVVTKIIICLNEEEEKEYDERSKKALMAKNEELINPFD